MARIAPSPKKKKITSARRRLNPVVRSGCRSLEGHSESIRERIQPVPRAKSRRRLPPDALPDEEPIHTGVIGQEAVLVSRLEARDVTVGHVALARRRRARNARSESGEQLTPGASCPENAGGRLVLQHTAVQRVGKHLVRGDRQHCDCRARAMRLMLAANART